jgi:hypothetical protein
LSQAVELAFANSTGSRLDRDHFGQQFIQSRGQHLRRFPELPKVAGAGKLLQRTYPRYGEHLDIDRSGDGAFFAPKGEQRLDFADNRVFADFHRNSWPEMPEAILNIENTVSVPVQCGQVNINDGSLLLCKRIAPPDRGRNQMEEFEITALEQVLCERILAGKVLEECGIGEPGGLGNVSNAGFAKTVLNEQLKSNDHDFLFRRSVRARNIKRLVAFIQGCVLSDLKLAYANYREQSNHGARAGRSFIDANKLIGEFVDLP